MLTTINGIEGLKARAGEDLGVSGWYNVTQAGIDAFADATSDHQWIHVDPERARDTPFGGTIAHGYYTLSLASHFMEELLHVDGVAVMINYGLNKVRFIDPLPVGDRVDPGLGHLVPAAHAHVLSCAGLEALDAVDRRKHAVLLVG